MPREIVLADSTNYSADNTIWPTADGGVLSDVILADLAEAANAADFCDARVKVSSGFGVVFRPAAASATGSCLSSSARRMVRSSGAGEVEQPFPSDDEILLLLLAG